MTTIVKHRRTGKEYILLGINGEAKQIDPSRFISGLFERDKSVTSPSATVCDVRGNMFLADIDDLVVVEVNGVKPADILPPPQPEEFMEEETRSQFDRDFADERAIADEEFEDDFEDDFEAEKKIRSPARNSRATQHLPIQKVSTLLVQKPMRMRIGFSRK